MAKMFDKSPIKTPPNMKLNEWQQSLMDEDIVNNPSDLAKLLLVLRNAIQDNDWPQEDTDLRQFIVEKIKLYFDGSGEAATETCFEMAVEYGFIGIKTDPETGGKKYVEIAENDLDRSHDWFCFDCDVIISKKSRQFIKCDQCLRVFHRKCCQQFDAMKDFKCRYCERVESETNGYINESQTVDNKRMSRLIRFLLDFVKIRMKKKFEEIDIKFENEENLYIYVFKKMSLSLIRQKVEREEYSRLTEFDDDFFVYMHNLYITQPHLFESGNNQKFSDLRQYMFKELQELRKCVDCYERANDKALHESNKEWFCLPCSPPHKPVFVKQKNSPYWPSKVIIAINENKKSEICFFESEKIKEKSKKEQTIFKKFEAKASEIKDINDSDVINQIKGNQRLNKPLELLVKYLESMEDKKPYLKTIETIKHNLSQKTVINEQSYEESIETVIKGVNTPSKPPSKSKQKSKASNTTPKTPKISEEMPSSSTPLPSLETKPFSVSKSRKKKTQSKSTSSRFVSPSTPILKNMTEEDDSIDSISERVPNLNISEEPPLLDKFDDNYTDTNVETQQNTTKRRSGRIAALTTPQTTPQKTDSKKKSDVKSVRVSKRKDSNKSGDDIELMEVDTHIEDKQNTETNESVAQSMTTDSQLESHLPETSDSIPKQVLQTVDNEMDVQMSQSLKAIDLSCASNSTQKRNQSSKQTVSVLENSSSKVLTMEASETSAPVVTPTPMTSTSRQTDITTTPSTSAIITTPFISNAPNIVPFSVDIPKISTPLTTAPSTSRMGFTSFGGTFNENEANITNNQSFDFNEYNQTFERFTQRLQELMQMKEPSISKIELDEKLIVISYHQKKLGEQMEKMKNELQRTKRQLIEVKSQRWCVVCQNVAKHYCCVRFYCSQNCQLIDWKNGHHSQCLELKK